MDRNIYINIPNIIWYNIIMTVNVKNDIHQIYIFEMEQKFFKKKLKKFIILNIILNILKKYVCICFFSLLQQAFIVQTRVEE